MFELDPPRSTGALTERLAALHEEIATCADAIPLEEFLAPQGDHWSPAEHIRHLVTANRALSNGMAAPRLLLALRFGVHRGESRSFEEIRELYRGALAAGGEASGPYDPSKRAIEMEPDALRVWLMARWLSVGTELQQAIDRWPERALNRYQAKHPLLGTLTVRELLFFTLYHNAHHARRIVERRSG